MSLYSRTTDIGLSLSASSGTESGSWVVSKSLKTGGGGRDWRRSDPQVFNGSSGMKLLRWLLDIFNDADGTRKYLAKRRGARPEDFSLSADCNVFFCGDGLETSSSVYFSFFFIGNVSNPLETSSFCCFFHFL